MGYLLHRGNSFSFDFNALLRLPHVACVIYLFWSKSKASYVYIGKTERSLKERLHEHRLDCKNPVLRAWMRYAPDDLIFCYVACTAGIILKLERRLIRQFDPSANKDHRT